MRIMRWMAIPVVSLFLFGCAANDNDQESSQENGNTQPINYETEKNGKTGRESKIKYW